MTTNKATLTKIRNKEALVIKLKQELRIVRSHARHLDRLNIKLAKDLVKLNEILTMRKGLR